MYENIWVRFYGDGTLTPRRVSVYNYIDKSNLATIENQFCYKQGSSWITTNQGNYAIPTKFISTVYGKKVNNITVGTSGCDFTSLVTCIKNITDSSEYNVYNIYIYNDIDLYRDLGGDDYYRGLTQTNGFMQGLILPNYVNLIGVGDISIKYNAPDSLATSANVPCISTINLTYNNELENLKIYGRNVRYVIHDETNNLFHDLKRKFKNCYIEHLGNVSGTWTSSHTLGCGCGSNCNYEYINCTFVNTVTPYLMHNNTNQKSSKLYFDNCEFIGWKQYGSVSLSGLSGTTTQCYATFNNCKLNGHILTTRDIWNVDGGGNSETGYICTSSSDNIVRVAFADETKKMRNVNGNTITKLSPVMIDSCFIKKIPSGQEHRFYGIALNDIENDATGLIKYRGIINITSLGIASADGDKIGIVNGELVKVTGNDYIGVVSMLSLIHI